MKTRKQTSANIQPCKGEIAERHNRREKELDYIRKELSHLNTYVQWIPISAEMQKIKAEYKKATGQRLQPNAHPIKEIVLVTDENTTPAQIDKFCRLIQNLGMTPLSYAIHMDEGHEDPTTGEWIPNHHAHVIVDTTCWEKERMVERTRKSNGKNIKDPSTGKPEKILVNAYAKTIKFTREDMSALQDYAAEATGLERPPSSTRQHLNAMRYKAKAQANDIQRLAGIIEDQQRQISAAETTVRRDLMTLQAQGKDVLHFIKKLEYHLETVGIEMDNDLIVQRNMLTRISSEDLSTASLPDLLKRFAPMSNAIVVLTMTRIVLAIAIGDKMNKSIDEKRQVIAEMISEIKSISLWKSAKKTVNAVLNKPVNEQTAKLRKEKNEMEKSLANLLNKNAELEQYKENKLRELETINQKVVYLEQRIQSLTNEKENLLQTIQKKDTELRLVAAKHRGDVERNIKRIAEVIVDLASPEQVNQYEQLGIPQLVGTDIWVEAIVTSRFRQAEKKHKDRENPLRNNQMIDHHARGKGKS